MAWVKHQVTAEEAGERLDKWLVKLHPDRSRSALQKLIEVGRVKVNGEQAVIHRWLKLGDQVKIDLPELVTQKLTITPNPKVALSVLAETDDYVVLNKPIGVVMHQSESHLENDTVANGLLARYPMLAHVGDDPLRPGLVHRLDQDVSGAVIVAKNAVMFDHLKQQFMERQTGKEYLALVHGVMSQSSGEIDFPIGRSLTRPTRMAARPRGGPNQGREALTEYTLVTQFQHYALLSVKIHTGRTHQIRVHLNAIGHPVVGDEIYKPASLKTQVKAGRVMLHAHQLIFNDLAGETVTVEAPVPAEFQSFVDTLK